jgi:hypothetical protein
LIPGTVVVNVDGGGALIIDDGTNYAIDYEGGRIRFIDGGSSTASVAASTAYEVGYQYRATREGEGAEIQEAKIQLTSKILTIAADRLATDITSEAIVFSRSQLNYDAVTRTISNLISQIRSDIDRRIFYASLSAAHQVANNSGGSWNSSTGDVEDLIEMIGFAKVKLDGREYPGAAIIASDAIADRLSNSDKATEAGGRPDFNVDAAGYTVFVKGLPVFRTPQFTDSYVLVVNEQLVAHRVMNTMMLKGPFPKYGSNGKLVASEMYYVEEYNGTDVPVNEKAAYVKIV